MVTIKDVARIAGVSFTTVSVVLNKARPVRKETAQRVLEAAKKLNYKPNRAAQSLVTKSTHILGIVIPNILNPFFAPIIKGIEERANKGGYMVMIANSDEDPSKAKLQLDVLVQHNVDGLIIVVADEFEKHRAFVQDLPIPTVLVDRKLPGLGVDLVQSDNELGAYLATKHLCSLGRTSIGLVIGPHTVSTHTDRLKGYRKALEEYETPFNESLVRSCDSNKEDGYDQVKYLLERSPTPDAIFVGSGRLSAGAYQAIMDSKLSVPDELSWICFDEMDWASFVRPAVTTVRQDTYEMGITAAELLLTRISSIPRNDIWGDEQEAPRLPPQLIWLKPELIVRESASPKSTT